MFSLLLLQEEEEGGSFPYSAALVSPPPLSEATGNPILGDRCLRKVVCKEEDAFRIGLRIGRTRDRLLFLSSQLAWKVELNSSSSCCSGLTCLIHWERGWSRRAG